MADLLNITLPVFLLIGFGYLSVWRGWYASDWVDPLMKFAQGFAIPCLLFRAVSELDLAANFDFRVIAAYYGAGIACFALGGGLAAKLFNRSIEDAVAIGFACLFANSVLLGIPITERAYGTEGLTSTYVIISVNALICYSVGIATMEAVKHRGEALGDTLKIIVKEIFGNNLMIGIVLGFAVNLSGLPLPEFFKETVDMMVRAALPAALFALGGILYRYKPEGDMRVILMVTGVTLIIRPALAMLFGFGLSLDTDQLRSVVLTASMAAGVNAFLFSSMYERAMRVAASAVLVGTAVSVMTVSIWLLIIP